MQPSRDISRLNEIMAALRTPETGCPWDLEQTFATIVPYTLEEAYEVADAIERGDVANLREELGDLLLQVVFHARMAEEEGRFDFGDVVDAITRKLIRRHPHVFGDARDLSSDEVKALWGRIKAEEKRERAEARRAAGMPAEEATGALAGVPLALPALTRALKLQEKAGKVGFDWNDPRAVLAKLREEIDEVEAELDANDARTRRRRSRRSAVRGRQSRPPPQRRSGSGAARRQRQVRTPLRSYRVAARRGRARAGGRDARRNGGAVERSQAARKTGAVATTFVALLRGVNVGARQSADDGGVAGGVRRRRRRQGRDAAAERQRRLRRAGRRGRGDRRARPRVARALPTSTRRSCCATATAGRTRRRQSVPRRRRRLRRAARGVPFRCAERRPHRAARATFARGVVGVSAAPSAERLARLEPETVSSASTPIVRLATTSIVKPELTGKLRSKLSKAWLERADRPPRSTMRNRRTSEEAARRVGEAGGAERG